MKVVLKLYGHKPNRIIVRLYPAFREVKFAEMT